MVNSGVDNLFTWASPNPDPGRNRDDRAFGYTMTLSFFATNAKSKRIVIGKNQSRGLPQNLEVKGQRPVFNVKEVVVDAVYYLVNAI